MEWSATLESCQLLQVHRQELRLRKYSFQAKPRSRYWGEITSPYHVLFRLISGLSPFLSLRAHRSFSPEFLGFPEWIYNLQLALFGAKEEQKDTIIFSGGGGKLVFASTLLGQVLHHCTRCRRTVKTKVWKPPLSELGEPQMNDVNIGIQEDRLDTYQIKNMDIKYAYVFSSLQYKIFSFLTLWAFFVYPPQTHWNAADHMASWGSRERWDSRYCFSHHAVRKSACAV